VHKLAFGGLVAALALTILFAFSYVGALHDPEPRHVPIGVVGPRAAAFVTSTGGAFAPRPLADEGAVRAALRRRSIAAGLVPPRLLVASAGGYSTAQYVEAAFRRAQPSMRVVDVAPLPRGDSRGLTLFYASIAFVFGGYFAATVVTTLVGPHSRSHGGAVLRVAALTVFAVLAGFLTALVVGPAIGTVPGHTLELGAIGALIVVAAALATSALQSALGLAGTLVAMVAFVMLGNSSAGGAYPGTFVPGFWRAVGPWLPTGAGFSALRAAIYFDGTAIAGRLLVLAGYALVGAVVTIALGWRRGLRAPELELATAAAV
jgi:hypothetical protein